MRKYLLSILMLIPLNMVPVAFAEENALPPSNVDYDSFVKLAEVVRPIREEYLVSLPEFLEMAKDPKTVILDARSKEKFDELHIKGAININFSDFTQNKLRELIPDPMTRILIYCNNNIDDEPISFPTKAALPSRNLGGVSALGDKKPLLLALNVPTYINLYGYGYRNVYELKDLVSPRDKRLELEGSCAGVIQFR